MSNPQQRFLRAALLLTCALALAIPATPQLSFSGAREDYPYTGGFAIGDFNGDGFPDIATSNSSNMAVILLNDGTGHYHQAAAIPGSESQFFATGDFNNDGFLDVAFTGYSTVYIALGNGDGTLRNLSQLSNVSTGDLKAVDLNGDGKLDLVIGGNPVSYCLGYGDGTVKPPISFSGVTIPFALVDVNGDKRPDIVGIYEGSFQVEINAGNGTFTLGPKTPIPTGYYQALAAGDIDGNGTADLVLSSSNPYKLTVFKGDGKGDFTAFSSTPLPLNADDVALLDINGDGKLDLLYNRTASSQQPATNLVLELGNGDGTFGTATNYATAGADNRIVQADTRHSGQLDLLTGGYQEISVLLNRGNDTFVQGSFFKLSGVLQSAVDGDFNHDGIRDLLVSVRLSVSPDQAKNPDQNAQAPTPESNSQFAGAYVLLGTGNPKAPFVTSQRLYIPPDVLRVATGDFNNDGNPDLAFVTGQDLVIYLGAANGIFTPGSQYPCICSTVAVGDFNGDGNIDIATSGVYLFPGKGDGTFGTPTVPFVGGSGFIAAGDFNADGMLDLITTQGNSDILYTATGHGNGTFSVQTSAVLGGVVAGAVADFNNDGALDVAVINGYDVYIYLNNGTGSFKQSSYLNVGFNSSANTIAVADFNHDGKMDVAVPGIDMMIFTGLGDGTFAPEVSFGAANYANVILADDFYDFGTAKLPDLIGIGQNGAISTLYNESH